MAKAAKRPPSHRPLVLGAALAVALSAVVAVTYRLDLLSLGGTVTTRNEFQNTRFIVAQDVGPGEYASIPQGSHGIISCVSGASNEVWPTLLAQYGVAGLKVYEFSPSYQEKTGAWQGRHSGYGQSDNLISPQADNTYYVSADETLQFHCSVPKARAVDFQSIAGPLTITGGSVLYTANMPASSLTLSFWVKFHATPSSSVYVIDQMNTGNPTGMRVSGFDGNMLMELFTDETAVIGVVPYDTFVPGVYRHVAITVGDPMPSPMKIYVDGVNIGVSSAVEQISGTITTQHPLILGGELKSNGTYGVFPGVLDDVRVYDRPITQAEAQLLSDLNPFNDPGDGLRHHWTLDEPHGPDFYDQFDLAHGSHTPIAAPWHSHDVAPPWLDYVPTDHDESLACAEPSGAVPPLGGDDPYEELNCTGEYYPVPGPWTGTPNEVIGQTEDFFQPTAAMLHRESTHVLSCDSGGAACEWKSLGIGVAGWQKQKGDIIGNPSGGWVAVGTSAGFVASAQPPPNPGVPALPVITPGRSAPGRNAHLDASGNGIMLAFNTGSSVVVRQCGLVQCTDPITITDENGVPVSTVCSGSYQCSQQSETLLSPFGDIAEFNIAVLGPTDFDNPTFFYESPVPGELRFRQCTSMSCVNPVDKLVFPSCGPTAGSVEYAFTESDLSEVPARYAALRSVADPSDEYRKTLSLAVCDIAGCNNMEVRELGTYVIPGHASVVFDDSQEWPFVVWGIDNAVPQSFSVMALACADEDCTQFNLHEMESAPLAGLSPGFAFADAFGQYAGNFNYISTDGVWGSCRLQ